jgi:hypothetical protein
LRSAFSLLALHRATVLMRGRPQPTSWSAVNEAALRGLREELDNLSAHVHDIQQQPPLTMVASTPKSGLNMSKRSQALRMHRRGESSEQIASSLEIPLQEVELLLKVHRIVLSQI